MGLAQLREPVQVGLDQSAEATVGGDLGGEMSGEPCIVRVVLLRDLPQQPRVEVRPEEMVLRVARDSVLINERLRHHVLPVARVADDDIRGSAGAPRPRCRPQRAGPAGQSAPIA